MIFPGGCLPSLGAIQRSVARRTDMRAVSARGHRAELRPHPPSLAWTLRAASSSSPSSATTSAFAASGRCTSEISEAGFHEARLRDLQLVYAKPAWPGEAPGPTHSQALSRARRAPVSDGQA